MIVVDLTGTVAIEMSVVTLVSSQAQSLSTRPGMLSVTYKPVWGLMLVPVPPH